MTVEDRIRLKQPDAAVDESFAEPSSGSSPLLMNTEPSHPAPESHQSDAEDPNGSPPPREQDAPNETAEGSSSSAGPPIMQFPEVPDNTAQPLPRFPADELRERYEQHFSDRWTVHAANTHALIEMIEEYNDLVDALFVKQENMFNDEIDEKLKTIEKEEEEQGIVPDTAMLPSALPRRKYTFLESYGDDACPALDLAVAMLGYEDIELTRIVAFTVSAELTAKLAAFFESMRNNLQTFLA
ncbi:hypothetical protein HDU89_004400 [Geranomyces variabilis]|nr:hypothetical protein HDU89_004400 [Geranomyces variabilis]